MDNRTKMLATSINKLYRRGAERNIRRIINKTHDVDVASVLESMGMEARIAIFQLVPDPGRQAHILAHLSRNSQEEIAHVLETHKLQGLLAEMESDDAADLLGHLPEEMSQKILSGLKQDELQDVEELMAYPEDSAGGMMGTEFQTMNESLKVSEAIQMIQKQDEDAISFYIYVANDTGQLVGVLSLKQLLLSKPSELLKDIMNTGVISVNISTDQNEVAKIVERYDFLSLPVVDEENQLVGVITVDDVIDVIREEAEEDIYAMGMTGASPDDSLWFHVKSRFPWLALAFLGGGVCYAILWNTLTPFSLEYMLQNSLSLLPICFLVVSTMSSQTVTMVVSFLRSQASQGGSRWWSVRKEFLIGFVLSIMFGVLFVLVTLAIKPVFSLPPSLSALLAVQMLGTVLVSLGIPLLISRLSFNPIVSAPSISMIFSNILAVVILVAYYAFG